MKQIKMDWETYQRELRKERDSGRREGVGEARRLVLEIIAGASTESVLQPYDGDDMLMIELEADLRPRLNRR